MGAHERGAGAGFLVPDRVGAEPGDVPMDRPHVQVEDGPAAELGSFWLWDLYCTAALVVGAIVALILGDNSLPERVIAALVILGMIVLYLGIARQRLRTTGEHREWALVAALVLMLATAIFLEPASMAALPALYPLFFMAVPLLPAAAAAVLVSLLPLVAVLVRQGTSSPNLGIAVGVTMLAVVISPVMGTWITKMMRQSADRARLLEELEASRTEITRLSRDAGVFAERERLAREIHDTLAQGFISIVALVQAAETEIDSDRSAARRHIRLAGDTARENLAEARAMVAASSPSLDGSLADAIRRAVQRFEQESSVAVNVSIPEPFPGLPTAVEVVVLRATQESLANIRKHADAAAVTVTVEPRPDSVRLLVTDDGVGLGPETGDGYGIAGMRQRAAQAGGTLTVGAGAQGGTTVEMEIPT